MPYTKVYWRPSQVPPGALVVLAIIALAALLMVETMRRQDTIADYGMMVGAGAAAMSYIWLKKKAEEFVEKDSKQSAEAKTAPAKNPTMLIARSHSSYANKSPPNP